MGNKNVVYAHVMAQVTQKPYGKCLLGATIRRFCCRFGHVAVQQRKPAFGPILRDFLCETWRALLQ